MAITVRKALPQDFDAIGTLLVKVYSQLDGFPKPEEQPAYYQMLQNIGDLTQKPGVSLFVAFDGTDLLGAVVYFADMSQYGSGGTATQEKDAAGFRLLAVEPNQRGRGIGKILTQKCIDQARIDKLPQVVIHSTAAMKVAWGMYEKMGFQRSTDLDFMQQELPVYGFRLRL